MSLRALITQRESTDQYGGRIDSLEAEYVEYFEQLGIQVCPVSNYMQDVVSFARNSHCEMLILSGGGVVPADSIPMTYREKTEEKLIEWAVEHDYPIIGICRGKQVLNCHFGGTVTKAETVPVKRAVREEHPITRLENGQTLYVNHFHGDVIRREDLADELIPLAIDEAYDTVEAFRHREKRIVAVQWHPERKSLCGETISFVQKLILKCK